MKTKKLNLNDLRVESFVTSLENKGANTVKGGVTTAVCVASMISFLSGVIVSATVTIATKGNKNQICDTAAYCGNTHDGGNGCSVNACM